MNPLFSSQLLLAVKSAVRHFRNNWIYGSLNILGMAIAFATLICILSYLHQETAYEDFYPNADRIYRPTYHVTTGADFEVHWARIPVDYINELPNEMPEVEKLIRFQNQEQKYLRIGEKRFKPEYAYITDQDVFEVFELPFLAGDPLSALSKPGSIVLTESEARKYFSRTNILGEEIHVVGDWSTEEKVYQVTGILQDLPVNTHLPIDVLLSFAGEEERTGWAYIYILLAEGTEIGNVERKMDAFIEKYNDPQSATDVSYEFQPLPEIHLHSQLAREIKTNGQFFYVRIFFWVGIFVWLIALVNFTNLSTALSIGRRKEAGVRKILGASKRNLIVFTFSEAIIFSLASLIVGALLAFLLFPVFSQLTGIMILPPMQYFIPLLLGIALLSGLLAGIFPSLLMTAVKILEVIKEGHSWSMRKRTGKLNIKRIMITVQFCATTILIGSAIVAHQQFMFINNKNLGLKPDQIIAIDDVPDAVTNEYIVFKERLKDLPGISVVSACMQVPSTEIRDSGPVLVRGMNEDVDRAPRLDIQIIDPDFIDMMNLSLVAGEDFSSIVTLNKLPEMKDQDEAANYLVDRPRQYLVNETAVRQLGWYDPAEAIGKEINFSIGPFELNYGPISGVIKDYHQESLKNKVDPTVMVVEPLWLRAFLIKVETGDIEKTIAGIEAIWNDLFPYAFEYHFLDALFDRLYRQDWVQLKLLSAFSLIAILISFIGLISLVAYALKSRSKELAIRRVIGANLRSLTILIGHEYLWILAIAMLVGVPVSFHYVSEWLQNFAYHISISPFVYITTFVILIVLLFFTTFLQTLRATTNNPVDALRDE